MRALLMLIVAVVCEVFGDSMLKLADGFKNKLALLGTAIGYGLSFLLISKVIMYLGLGVTYAVWSGLGIALTMVVGVVFWREKLCLEKTLGLLLVIAGVALVNFGI